MATQNRSETSSSVNYGEQPKGAGGQPQQNNRQVTRSRQQEGGLARKQQMQPYFPSPAEFMGNPFAAMRRMQEDMDRMFAQAFGGLGGGLTSGGTGSYAGGLTEWSPAIEIKQKENQLVVCAELPGLKPDEVQVEVNEDALIIQGERRHEETHNEGGVHRTERQYGRFYRAIPLPEGVNADQANAQFRDGVLEVTVPLPEQQMRRRTIPISGGGGSASQNTVPTSRGTEGPPSSE